MRQFYSEEEHDTSNATHVINDATIIKDRPQAVLIRADALGTDTWIPQSVIHDDSEIWNLKNAGPGKLVIKRWFAEKKGWTK